MKKRTEGLSVFLVDMKKALGNGMEIKPIRTMVNHSTTEVFFDELEIPADSLIGEEGKGFRNILDGMNAERILISHESLGDARWFLKKAVDYANERQVFGRPIGQNQGIQFPLAKAYANTEAAALMAARAAQLFEAGEPCGPESNMAKMLAADAAWEAGDNCVQNLRWFRLCPRIMTLSENGASRASTGLPRSRPIWCLPLSPSMCSACRAPIEPGMSKPLEGITVVALEQAVAAPYCTSRLADAGARVIKIERAEGDFARGYDRQVGGHSAYFVWLNRGKESVVLDIKQTDDAAVLERILSKADVFVQNLAPGAAARAGFGSEDLRARYPKLITVDITGYGEEGEYADMKAYDFLVQGESGLISVTGSPEVMGRVGALL